MQQPAKFEVRWGSWFSEGWQMFAERWGVWVVDMLILIAAFAVVVVPLYVALIVSAVNTQGQPSSEPPTGIILLFYMVFYPYALLVSSFFAAGCYNTAMKQLRGEPISVGDLFGGGHHFLRMIGLTVMFGIVTGIGFVLCLFPGFLVMGMWFFAFPLVVGHNLGPIEAVSASFAVTRTNLLRFAAFASVVYLLAGAGAYACGIGAVVTYPLLFTITTVAYRDCFGVEGARRFGPAPPPVPGYTPSYGDTRPGDTPPPPLAFGTATCPQCQSTVSANASFCPRCGGILRR